MTLSCCSGYCFESGEHEAMRAVYDDNYADVVYDDYKDFDNVDHDIG